jgi:hypothetical protein
MKVLAYVDDPDRPRQPMVAPSRLGVALFGEDGWDPFCEDPATLWLLHWLLVAPPSIAPVWWVALHEFPAIEFTHDELELFTADYLSGVSEWPPTHPSAVKKDVSCFLRMYAAGSAAAARATFDDVVDNPFAELGVLRSVDDRRRYRFVIGSKATLPALIALYACLDFLARTETNARTVNLSKLATEPGGPGRALKLTEAALAGLLEDASRELQGVRLTSSTGAPQLSFDTDPAVLATAALWAHYRRLDPDLPFVDHPVAGAQAETPFCAPPLVTLPASTRKRVRGSNERRTRTADTMKVGG